MDKARFLGVIFWFFVAPVLFSLAVYLGIYLAAGFMLLWRRFAEWHRGPFCHAPKAMEIWDAIIKERRRSRP